MSLLAPGFYECPIANLPPRLAMITYEGETWVGAKRIPDRLLHMVWPHLIPIDGLDQRIIELIKNDPRKQP